METTFELNTPQWFELKNCQEIDGFDKDDYGNTWYNVTFQGDAETFMWLAKEQPEEGKKYWGHLELTKSGKRLRFKRDKEPEDTVRPAGATEKSAWQPKNETQVTLNMCWKNLLNVVGVPQTPYDKAKFWEMVKEHTDELLAMGNFVDSEKSQTANITVSTPTTTKFSFNNEPPHSDDDYQGDLDG